MAFQIKTPFSIATHVKKFTSVASFKNKQEAGAIGMIGGVLMAHDGTSVVPVAANVGVTASGGATRTLLAATSGSINLFDAADGIEYILPTPVVGLRYRFLWTVLQTSAAHAVVTANESDTFLNGAVITFSGEDVTPSATLGPKAFYGNGSSHTQVSTNKTTTGGGIGSWLEFVCTTTTIWTVSGVIMSPSGTIATPFLVA
jgi:hypothetical protein